MSFGLVQVILMMASPRSTKYVFHAFMQHDINLIRGRIGRRSGPGAYCLDIITDKNMR